MERRKRIKRKRNREKYLEVKGKYIPTEIEARKHRGKVGRKETTKYL